MKKSTKIRSTHLTNKEKEMNKIRPLADSLTDVSSQITSSYEAMLFNLKNYLKRPELEQKLVKKRKHSVDSQTSPRTRTRSNPNKSTARVKHTSVTRVKKEDTSNNKTNTSNSSSNDSKTLKSKDQSKSVWADESVIAKWIMPVVVTEQWPDKPGQIKYTKPKAPNRKLVLRQQSPARQAALAPVLPQRLPRKNDFCDENFLCQGKPPIPPTSSHSVPPKQNNQQQHLAATNLSTGKIVTMPRKIIYESFYGRQLKNLDFRNAE